MLSIIIKENVHPILLKLIELSEPKEGESPEWGKYSESGILSPGLLVIKIIQNLGKVWLFKEWHLLWRKVQGEYWIGTHETN